MYDFLIDILSVTTFLTQPLKHVPPKIAVQWKWSLSWSLYSTPFELMSLFFFLLKMLQWLSFGFVFFLHNFSERSKLNCISHSQHIEWPGYVCPALTSGCSRYAAIGGRGTLCVLQLERHTDVLIGIEGSLCYKAYWKLLLPLITATGPPCRLVSR